MAKEVIHTDKAPAAIGAYSQAVKIGNTIYVSGQIPLDPSSMQIVEGGILAQTHQVFRNLQAICQQAGGTLNDIVKLNVYLTDMANFAEFNEIMGQYFAQPFPARAAVGVASLPRSALVEAEGVMVIAEDC